MKVDKLAIRPQGEVADLELEFGWGCGIAKRGIALHIKEHPGFNKRGGVLTKSDVKKMIAYLKKYLPRCKDR